MHFNLALLYLSHDHFSNFSLNPLIHPGSYITIWVLISSLWRWKFFGNSSWLSYNFSIHESASFCAVFPHYKLTRFSSTLTSLHHYSETLTMCMTYLWKTVSNGQVLLISVLNIYQSSFSLHMSSQAALTSSHFNCRLFTFLSIFPMINQILDFSILLPFPHGIRWLFP